jgi:hypothetical protein
MEIQEEIKKITVDDMTERIFALHGYLHQAEVHLHHEDVLPKLNHYSDPAIILNELLEGYAIIKKCEKLPYQKKLPHTVNCKKPEKAEQYELSPSDVKKLKDTVRMVENSDWANIKESDIRACDRIFLPLLYYLDNFVGFFDDETSTKSRITRVQIKKLTPP